jgi:hypothetical protein
MLPNMKTSVIAAVTALSIALTAAAPAQALGRNERNFLKGVAATVIIGAILNDANNRAQARPVPQPQPEYRHHRRHQEPRYYEEPSYNQPSYNQQYRTPARVIGSSSSIYSTPAGTAFNAYSAAQRRMIQSRLRNYGYYSGGIDGSFGPGTYRAVVAYARDAGGEGQLSNRGGAFGVYDGLLN